MAALAALLHGAAFADSARILYHEPLRASAATSTRTQKQSTEFAYGFEAFGRRFDLTLARNERLALAKTALTEGTSLRLYKGTINGADDSWVRLGVRGDRVEGLLWDGQEMYVIEPVDAARKTDSSLAGLPASGSIVYRLSDTRLQTPAACAATHPAQITSGLDQYRALAAELTATANAVVASNPTRRIELSAIGDALYREGHASEQSARDEILLRLNNVDGIFSSQIGVAIQVPTVVFEDTSDALFSGTTDANTLLSELGQLRKNTPELRSRGLTHLFTGRDLDGDTVGVAYTGDNALCHSQYGAGLTQTANLSIWLESLVAAHEIGHNFGAYHDGEDAPGSNAGECPATSASLYLMAAVVDGNHDQFSDCSRTTIRNSALSAVCVTEISTADIGVATDIGTVRAIAGTTFTWTFDVTNVGSAVATGTRAQASLPPALTIVEAWVTGGTCTAGAGLISCDLGDVAGNVTRTINARLRSDSVASNTAALQVSATNDAGLNNNQGQGNIDIEAGVDLALSLTAPGSIDAGQAAAGTITLQNLSDTSAQDVAIDFTATSGLSFRSASIGSVTCTPTDDGMRCALASVEANATLTGNVSFEAASAGAFTVSTTVSSAELDSNASNNTASAVIEANDSAGTAEGIQSSGSGGGGGGSLGWEMLLLSALWPRVRRIRSDGNGT